MYAHTAGRNHIRKYFFVKGTICCKIVWCFCIMEQFRVPLQYFRSKENASVGSHRITTFVGPFKPLQCSHLLRVCISTADCRHLKQTSRSVDCTAFTVIWRLHNLAWQKHKQAVSLLCSCSLMLEDHKCRNDLLPNQRC